MKAISLWQPFAALAVNGYKFHETRPFPPPETLKVGDRFAIASTKQPKSEQQIAAEHPRLLRYYQHRSLPHWSKLPRGCIVGTVALGGCRLIDRHMVMVLDEEEYVYGDWSLGRFAWLLRDPIALKRPIPVRGQQGIWNYDGCIRES